jgi:hypothetical protein
MDHREATITRAERGPLIPFVPLRKMKASWSALLVACLLVCVFSVWVNEAMIVALVGILSAIVFVAVACREFNLAVRLGTKELWGILGVAALIVALGWTNLPLRVVFLAFHGKFDRLAGELVAGRPVHFPTSIGPFQFVGGGVRDFVVGGVRHKTAYFICSGDVNEINGFVNHPEGYGFNLWSVNSLGKGWSYVCED